MDIDRRGVTMLSRRHAMQTQTTANSADAASPAQETGGRPKPDAKTNPKPNWSHELTQRSAWMDKFATPSRKALLEPLAGVPLVDQAVTAMQPATESIMWLGVPWRWTLAYRHPTAASERVVYLVPDPESPRLAVALEPDILATIDLKAKHRFLRDGLAGGTRVGDRVWTEWPLTSKAQVADLTGFLLRTVLGVDD